MGPVSERSFPLRQSFRRLECAVVGAMMVGLLASACQRSAAQVKPADPPAAPTEEGLVRIPEVSRQFIEVEEMRAAKTDAGVTAPARVDFRDGAVSQVGAPLEGRVVTVHVLLGQRVRAGDPLVTLDCPEAANLRAAGAVAQASLRETRAELERQRRMQQEGVGIERDVVAAETKTAEAEAELARVEAESVSIGKGTASAVIVRSPIAGVVIGRKASAGMAVQRGGDPLVEIGDASALWVVADVFERDLSRVRVGAKTRMTFTSVDRSLIGRVSSLGTVVASSLRTAPVFLTIEGAGASLRPGMYGRVEIETIASGFTLPVAAVLIKDGKEPVVYVQKDPLTFVRRRVVTGFPVGDRVPIVSGLSPGDKVVIRGALLLDGAADQLL